MLESSFHAVHSSFQVEIIIIIIIVIIIIISCWFFTCQAVLGVAEHFSKMKLQLSQVRSPSPSSGLILSSSSSGFLCNSCNPVHKIPLHEVPLSLRSRNKQSRFLWVGLEVLIVFITFLIAIILMLIPLFANMMMIMMMMTMGRSANLGGEMADFLTEGDLKPTTRWWSSSWS